MKNALMCKSGWTIQINFTNSLVLGCDVFHSRNCNIFKTISFKFPIENEEEEDKSKNEINESKFLVFETFWGFEHVECGKIYVAIRWCRNSISTFHAWDCRHFLLWAEWRGRVGRMEMISELFRVATSVAMTAKRTANIKTLTYANFEYLKRRKKKKPFN